MIIIGRVSPYLVSLLVSTSISAAVACPCSEIQRPAAADPSVNRTDGLEFSHTEKYQQEFAAAIAGARAACEKRIGQPNMAIVADIDETLLDNRPEFEKHQNFKWNEFSAWANSSDSKVLKPTAELLSWAREKGFAVFLVTGRNEDLRRGTIENLIKQNVAYDGLLMRTDRDHRRAEDAKTAHRKYIESLGFTIVANIGDQYSDLYGGYAEDCEKLPNKMYYIP